MKTHLEQEGCRTRVTVVPPGFETGAVQSDRKRIPAKVLLIT